jgi:hypothetical protein
MKDDDTTQKVKLTQLLGLSEQRTIMTLTKAQIGVWKVTKIGN